MMVEDKNPIWPHVLSTRPAVQGQDRCVELLLTFGEPSVVDEHAPVYCGPTVSKSLDTIPRITCIIMIVRNIEIVIRPLYRSKSACRAYRCPFRSARMAWSAMFGNRSSAPRRERRGKQHQQGHELLGRMPG